MTKPSFTRALLHPKYWHTWLGFAMLWVLVNALPLAVLHILGNGLGRALGFIIKKRAKISRKNIDLCFPEKTDQEKKHIYTESMKSAGRGVFETGIAWFCPRWRLKRMFIIEGLEHIEAAQKNNQGALFLGIHFTTIEICAAFINITSSIDGFYRPNFNKAFDYVQRKGRERHNTQSAVIPRENVRDIIRNLKSGRVINYATDQDYGRKHSIFVPFFNIPTATIPAPSQLTKIGKALALPYTNGWDAKTKKYKICIHPPFENFPSESIEEDATRINQFIEAQIRANPEQYLWSHRRFKTRPDGQKDFYHVETERYRRKRDKQKAMGKKTK